MNTQCANAKSNVYWHRGATTELIKLYCVSARVCTYMQSSTPHTHTTHNPHRDSNPVPSIRVLCSCACAHTHTLSTSGIEPGRSIRMRMYMYACIAHPASAGPAGSRRQAAHRRKACLTQSRGHHKASVRALCTVHVLLRVLFTLPSKP